MFAGCCYEIYEVYITRCKLADFCHKIFKVFIDLEFFRGFVPDIVSVLGSVAWKMPSSFVYFGDSIFVGFVLLYL